MIAGQARNDSGVLSSYDIFSISFENFETFLRFCVYIIVELEK